MSSDKTEQIANVSDPAAVSAGEKQSDGIGRNKLSEHSEHHYEPEAHHDWFPSERFFVSWLTVSCVGFVLLCLAVTAPHLISPGFQAGEIAEQNIKANTSMEVLDETATKVLKDRARAAVLPVFKPSSAPSPVESVTAKVAEIEALQKIGLTHMAEVTVTEHMELLKATDADFEAIFSTGKEQLPDELQKIKTKLWKAPTGAKRSDTSEKTMSAEKVGDSLRRQRSALNALLSKNHEVADYEETIAIGLSPTDMPNYSETLKSAANRLYRLISKVPVEDADLLNDTAIEFVPDAWNGSLRKASASLVSSVMIGSCAVDKAATEVKSDKVAASVKPVMKQIHEGDVIVFKGQEITPENANVLQQMGVSDKNRFAITAGLLLCLAAAVAVVTLFLYTFEAKLLFSTRSIAMMYTVCITTVLLGVVLGKTYPQIVPLPAAALLLSIFFGQRAAAAVTLPLAIFIAVDHLIDFNNLIALSTAAGAAIGTYSKRRHALVTTGLAIGMLQSFGFLAALAVAQTQLTASELGSHIGMEFLGGIASSIVAIGILPFLENIFGLVTPFRLAELTDADQPLLRRLEENAPGTYQHSLAVANLAESGARAIGGDVNLVRAGAYYHDVGKMVRPKFFIENQLGAANPHESMTPEQSRERVLAHVTDGLDLAKEYALPKAVQDFIPMHQGTSLMAFFYHKACMRDGVDNVDAMFYRYPGPKPQSKETSIVMLADVSEAVTHSMKDPTQEEVEAAISKVFQNRWDDGQFIESGLSYNEMQRVMRAFVRVWRTLHHDRLKYPSTTTGRMPVPPENLPTKASLENIVMANEFASPLPVHDESETQKLAGLEKSKNGTAKSAASDATTEADAAGAPGDSSHHDEETMRDMDCC